MLQALGLRLLPAAAFLFRRFFLEGIVLSCYRKRTLIRCFCPSINLLMKMIYDSYII